MAIGDGSEDAPLVSVVIPAHNAEAFLGETIDSVLSQTYRNLEVLVVDDGSTDRTAEIARSAASSDSRVRLIRQKNGGVADARNQGIRESHGLYVACIDADDIWYPENIKGQIQRVIDSGFRAKVVYSWSAGIDENSRLTGWHNSPDGEGNVLVALVYRYLPANSSSSLFYRQCFDEVGGYDPTLRERNAQGCEDWDLHLRLAERFSFHIVREFLVGYRLLPTSMSVNDSVMARSYEITMDRFRRRHPEIPAHVFRWSESRFCYYLALRCGAAGRSICALRWLARAAILDPLAMFLRPRGYFLGTSCAMNVLLARPKRPTPLSGTPVFALALPFHEKPGDRTMGEVRRIMKIHNLMPAQRLERRRLERLMRQDTIPPAD